MSGLVFTKEYYNFNAYLNPTSTKIGTSCLKKSIFVRQGGSSHYRNLSLDDGRSSRYERYPDPEEKSNRLGKDSPILTSSIFKKKKAEIDHNMTAPSIKIQKFDTSDDKLKQLSERNLQLQNQLKSQNIKMQNLRSKCEQLQNKLEVYTNRSQLNSSFSSIQSTRTSHREQLKAIRQKLRGINFSKIYQMINQSQKK